VFRTQCIFYSRIKVSRRKKRQSVLSALAGGQSFSFVSFLNLLFFFVL